ncbi:MAG: hypothetical protein AABW81_04130 [Nanoarchaeota archaeon]
MRIFVIIIVFLAVSALLIISNNNLKMYQQEDITKFSNLYLKWTDKIYGNLLLISRDIAKSDWLP